jgi:hypothetical protein
MIVKKKITKEYATDKYKHKRERRETHKKFYTGSSHN